MALANITACRPTSLSYIASSTGPRCMLLASGAFFMSGKEKGPEGPKELLARQM